MGTRGSAEAKDSVNRGLLATLRRIRVHMVRQQGVAYRAMGYGSVGTSIAVVIKALDAEIEATQKRIDAP